MADDKPKYWRPLGRYAMRQALKDAKLDSGVLVVISLGAQALAASGLWWLLGEFTNSTGWGRAITAATPFLTFPVALVVRSVLAPAALAANAQEAHTTEVEDLQERLGRITAALEALNNPADPPGYADHVYQYGKPVGAVHGDIQDVQNGICIPMLADTDDMKLGEAIFFRGKIYAVGPVGGSIANFSSTTLGPDGPKHVRLTSVLKNVMCYPLGTYATVKRPMP